MKARRGDLSGPVLAILVTLVLLAIGAAIVAYFVLLGTAPQQGVVAVVGQPTISKRGDGFVANITIKNVGSANITITTGTGTNVRLNITGQTLPLNFPAAGTIRLAPGATITLGFHSTTGWSSVADRESVSGALIIRDVTTMEVVFRVIRVS